MKKRKREERGERERKGGEIKTERQTDREHEEEREEAGSVSPSTHYTVLLSWQLLGLVLA